MLLLDLVSLSNFLWIIGILMILGGTSNIVGFYLLEILAHLNIVLVELLAYSGILGLLWSAETYFNPRHPNIAVFVALTGCLAMIPCYFFSLHLHFVHTGNSTEKACQGVFSFCAVVWSLIALRLDSSLIGFCSVGALFGALGFFAAATPFCYAFGFTSEDVIPRCMGISFYLLVVYVWSVLHGYTESPIWRVFQPGVLGFGTFIYFLGWLLVTNRFYWTVWVLRELPTGYWLCNAGALLSGMAAIALGGIPELRLLQSVGGTFFGLWVLAKYVDIAMTIPGAWAMLGGGSLLWSIGYLTQRYPEYVLSWSKIGG